MTSVLSDLLSGVSLLAVIGIVAKGSRIAGRYEKSFEASQQAFKEMADDLKDLRRESTMQFQNIADKFMEVAVVQERHTVLLDALTDRVERGGI